MHHLEYYENIPSHSVDRLSARQRHIIKKTFKILDKDTARVEAIIFARLLCKYPVYKNLWPQFRAIPYSSLISSSELQMYGINYINAMRFLVGNIDNNIALKESIYKIAYVHKKRGVYKTHIKAMSIELLDVLNDRLKKTDSEMNEAMDRVSRRYQ